MQRDLKVGLSLGVLVLGVVGALLFRRDQLSDTPRPSLKMARKIDERIAEGPRTPYMTGDVEFDSDDSDDMASDETTGGRPAHTVPPSWLNDEDDPFQISKNDKGQFEYQHQARRADTGFDPVQPLAPNTERHATGTAPAAQQTHVIESGDSLSQLAQRYLGSQGRYQEIYDANREVLTDVNQLPLGATIVIPSDAKTSAKQPTGSTARSAMGQPDKARGKITDVSTFEPLAPPSESATSATSQTTVLPEPPTADGASPAKVQETKKFVTPSRLPFASRNHAAAGNSRKKTLDPEGEDFIPEQPTAGNSAQSEAEPRHYQVRKGDSLEKISTKIYGNGKRAADIYAANRKLLSSPDAVREGQELVLPE